jgi:hypothetical protein
MFGSIRSNRRKVKRHLHGDCILAYTTTARAMRRAREGLARYTANAAIVSGIEREQTRHDLPADPEG